jgi:hypothetical protein
MAQMSYNVAPHVSVGSSSRCAGNHIDGLPNTSGSLILRIYLPTNQNDPQAGVPLPSLSLKTALGTMPLSFGSSCTSLPGNTGGPANALLDQANVLPGLSSVKPTDSAYNSQSFTRVFAGQVYDPVLNMLPAAVASVIPKQPGITLSNPDFPYLASNVAQYYGKVIVIRFKPPTFPDTVRGQSVVGNYQERFWSICNNAALKQGLLRAHGCLTDFQTPPGPNRYVTVVISDLAHRPSAAINPATGVYWLPWGPTPDDYVLYRVGVPSPSWANSPLGISHSATNQVVAAQTVMGAYYPVARYCSESQILNESVDSCFTD